jgi:hypothetical protein
MSSYKLVWITDSKAYMIRGRGHGVGHQCCVHTVAFSWFIDFKLQFIVFYGFTWPSFKTLC